VQPHSNPARRWQFATQSNRAPAHLADVRRRTNVNPGSKKRVRHLRGVKPIAYACIEHDCGHLGTLPTPRRRMGRGPQNSSRSFRAESAREVSLRAAQWTISEFSPTTTAARESEVWADVDDLFTDYHHKNRGMHVLQSCLRPGELSFNQRYSEKKDPRLHFTPKRKKNSTRGPQNQSTISSVLRIDPQRQSSRSAPFGGMNTMYAAVARTSREIGVLRALGFGPGKVLATRVSRRARCAACGRDHRRMSSGGGGGGGALVGRRRDSAKPI